MNKPKMTLVGMDGNAFSVLGNWSRAARRAGWSKEQIDVVMKEAMSGSYDHLLCTIMDNIEEPEEKQQGD
jgi:hypothetical protein